MADTRLAVTYDVKGIGTYANNIFNIPDGRDLNTVFSKIECNGEDLTVIHTGSTYAFYYGQFTTTGLQTVYYTLVDDSFIPSFSLCEITAVHLPDTIKRIENRVFANLSGVTEYNLPEGLEYIGNQAFINNSSLTGITIPSSVTAITSSWTENNYSQSQDPKNPFFGCSSLASFSGKCASSDGKYLYSGTTLIAVVPGSAGSTFVIPNNITTIGDGAFAFSNYTYITIPDTVNVIEANAFFGMPNLKEITIPRLKGTLWGKCWFERCASLENVVLKNNSGVLHPQTDVFLPSFVTGSYAFAGCTSLTSLTVYQQMSSGSSSSPYTFSGLTGHIGTGGTLYYNSRSDSTAGGLLTNNSSTKQLGYYGWTGETFNVDPLLALEDKYVIVGSGETLLTDRVDEVYCRLDHITYSSNGDFTVTAETRLSGLLLTVVDFSFPANTTYSQRGATVDITLYDTSGNTYEETIIIVQEPAPAPEIVLDTENVSVGSAATSTTITYTTDNCTFDHFTYSSNGDFTVTAQTGAGNTIIFTFPPNDMAIQKDTMVDITFYDTSGNTYTDTLTIYQDPVVFNKSMELYPTSLYATSAQTSTTVNVLTTNCVFSSFTYYNVNSSSFPLTPTKNGNSIDITFSENPINNPRSTVISFTLKDTDGNNYTKSVSLSQSASSTPTPVTKSMSLDANAVTVSSSTTGYLATVITQNCTFDHFTYSTGGSFPITAVTSGANGIYCMFPANNTSYSRGGNAYITLYDTDGDTEAPMLRITQEPGGTAPQNPSPWTSSTDSNYTWYSDPNKLKILPASKTLAATEATAYYPVTAHGFNNVEVRAQGNVVFTYELRAEADPSYNSHSLYCTTTDNTGTSQQASDIKLVAYSGTSAYSASTIMLKNPPTQGYITVSPNSINAGKAATAITGFITLTNCSRDMTTENSQNSHLSSIDWLTVSYPSNTAITFTFAANNGAERDTYYMVCGKDASDNNVFYRVIITQAKGDAAVTITPSTTSLSKEGGSFTARVQSTVEGTFSFSLSSWMTITSYVPSSSKGGTLYIDYSANTGSTSKNGTITVSEQISTSPYILTASTSVTQTAQASTSFININPSDVFVSSSSGVATMSVTYNGLQSAPVLVEGSGNMSIIAATFDGNSITVVYDGNNTSSNKTKSYTLTGVTTGGAAISKTFTLTQAGINTSLSPVWKDYVLSLTAPGQGYINYTISKDDVIIYTGRAYAMGEGGQVEIYLNQLIKNYLSNEIKFENGYQTITEWLGNFFVSSTELGDITNVGFFEDYSYENRTNTNVMTLNNPITNEVVEGGYVPFSFFVTGNRGDVTIFQETGSSSSLYTAFTISDNEQHRYFFPAQVGKTYRSQGVRYKTIKMCDARYSLYYVNSYGGVDVLPFKGAGTKKTDNITRLNYSSTFRNNTKEFENVNYLNEIKASWVLETGWLTDEQSKKMNEVVESTIAYLYDAQEQTYIPVVMTDKKLEYKTYRNQGKRLYNYSISIEESQSRERR